MIEANSKIQLLVADDDPDILGFFRAIIKDPRYVLHLVSNGVQALQKAREHEIAVAFLDINMPELGGIDTLVEWKELQKKTQIVMISSYSDGNLVRLAIEKGAYSYLFKPLNKMDVFSVTVKSLSQAGVHSVFSFK